MSLLFLSLFLLANPFGEIVNMQSSTPKALSPFFAETKTIQTNELKTLLDSDTNVILVDARTHKNDDGHRIGNARLVPPDAPMSQIRLAVPSISATVVVYCSSERCPASTQLARRISSMGYKNVYVYKPGIMGWVKAGNKVRKP